MRFKLLSTLTTLTLTFPALCGICFAQPNQESNYYDQTTVSLIESSLLADAEFNHKTFLIDVPRSKNYYIEFWGLPAKYGDGTFTKYSIFLDDEIIGTVSPEFGNWQALKVNAGTSLGLNQGEHTLSIATLAPEIPMVETVRISENKAEAAISSEEYEDYLAASREGETLDFFPETYSTQSFSESNSNETAEDVPVLYTFYKSFYWTKGEEITLTSSSSVEHLMDVIFYGHPKKAVINRSPSLGDPYPGINDSIKKEDPIINLKDLNKLYIPATSDEMQGLNWLFVSEQSLHSASQEIPGYVRVPMTGYYMVRITTPHHLVSSVADFNMNDKYIYEEVPINYYGINHVFPADSPALAMTLSENNGVDDPMIFVHGADADRVVAFNDDASSSQISKYGLTMWDACLSQSYRIKTSNISISSFSSLTPVSTCKVIYGSDQNVLQLLPPNPVRNSVVPQNNLTEGKIEMDGDYSLNGNISINSTLPVNKVSVYGIDGSMKNSFECSESQFSIPMDKLNINQSGLYIIRIETDDCIKTEKVLVK